MLSVNFISVGKLSEEYFRSAVSEYAKRLGGFCKVVFTQLCEATIDEKGISEKAIAAALNKEADAILAALAKKTIVVALCVEGRALSSEGLAEWIGDACLHGASSISFIVGSSHGLSDLVKQRANLRLSFSKMTFPHQLMQVILCEQVYRAFMINAGAKYHK